MSVAGQSRQFGRRPTTSGLPLETDIAKDGRHVSKVPTAELGFIGFDHERKDNAPTFCRASK
jgi:hypothetical protein